MQRDRRLLFAGVALTLVGALGLMLYPLLGSLRDGTNGSDGRAQRGQRQQGQSGRFASNGERIYFTGIGHNGPIRADWDPSGGYGGYGGMMDRRRGRRQGVPRMGCVRCHREDGQGGPIGMMGGGVEAPDIRYSTLSQGGIEFGEDESSTAEVSWTDADIARAIRDGVEPDGERLDRLMPRWKMDSTDMRDTIDYLKELSDR